MPAGLTHAGQELPVSNAKSTGEAGHAQLTDRHLSLFRRGHALPGGGGADHRSDPLEAEVDPTG